MGDDKKMCDGMGRGMDARRVGSLVRFEKTYLRVGNLLLGVFSERGGGDVQAAELFVGDVCARTCGG